MKLQYLLSINFFSPDDHPDMILSVTGGTCTHTALDLLPHSKGYQLTLSSLFSILAL